MPAQYKELDDIQQRLKNTTKTYRYKFTIEKELNYICYNVGVDKRNGVSAVKMAADMYKEGMIDAETAILMSKSNQLVELLLQCSTQTSKKLIK